MAKRLSASDEAEIVRFISFKGINLADLPVLLWDSASDEDRDRWACAYAERANHEAWAWDGMEKMLLFAASRGESPPRAIQEFAGKVSAGTLPRPKRTRSTPSRDYRIQAAVDWWNRRGITVDAAMEAIAAALPDNGRDRWETVKSARLKGKKVARLLPF